MEEKLLRISGLVTESIVDGPGYRFTIFTQGCPHFCPGCHNPQTHNQQGGEMISMIQLLNQVKKNPLLRGVTFSGGEPFLQASILAELAGLIHQSGKDVIIYSGYTYEFLHANADQENCWGELLRAADFLIDGPFLLEQKSLELPFRGSANQRIIDLGASRKTGRVVEIESF